MDEPKISNVGTASSASATSTLTNELDDTKILIIGALVLFIFILFGLNGLLTPSWDPREPPLIKPTIPWIGHILGIITKQSKYHHHVHAKHPSLPIVTLQMLGGKLYSAYDPYVVNALLRSKVASPDHFWVEFGQKVFSLRLETFSKVTPALLADFTDSMHTSFSKGMLDNMKMQALGYISDKMGSTSRGRPSIDKVNAGKEKVTQRGIEVENLYLWLRDVMTQATTKALYGDNDPFSKNQELIEDIWDFEEAIPYFILSLAPSITMPKRYKARKRLQDAMSEYYAAGTDMTDPTASHLVVHRARALRKHGMTGDEIGYTEMVLPSLSVFNTVPIAYWLMLFILQRPNLLSRVRAEAEEAAEVSCENDGRLAVIIDDAKQPLLVSCYRETMRLVNNYVASRRLAEDLVVRTQEGRPYLLKKGVDLHIATGVPLKEEALWEDASVFDPERFISSNDDKRKMTDGDRARKAAFVPFGGGRHLCPGRNFAFSEIIALVTVMLVGFDIEATGVGFGGVKMGGPQLVSSACKPEKAGKGLGAKMNVRKGWENVEWKSKC